LKQDWCANSSFMLKRNGENEKALKIRAFREFFGRSDMIRTCDPCVPNPIDHLGAKQQQTKKQTVTTTYSATKRKRTQEKAPIRSSIGAGLEHESGLFFSIAIMMLATLGIFWADRLILHFGPST